MKFYSPKGPSLKSICNKLKPECFLQDMLDRGMIEEITDDYSSDVYHLCNNAVAWMLLQLASTYYYYEVVVVKGSFNGKDHSWLKVGNFIFDLTLAQFIECPRLAITKTSDDIGYEPYAEMTVDEYKLHLFAENNLTY